VKKRILSLLLTLVMLIGLVPTAAFPVFAEESEEQPSVDSEGNILIWSYEQLVSVAQNARINESYRLATDIYQTDNSNDLGIWVRCDSLWLDLNGHVLSRETRSLDSALFFVCDGSTLNIYDSSPDSTGTCIYNNNYVSDPCSVINNSGGNVIINGGNYIVKMDNPSAEAAVLYGTSGEFTVYDGYFDSTQASNGNAVKMHYSNSLYDEPDCIIYGGRFYSKKTCIEAGSLANYSDVYYPYVFVLGGEFYTKRINGDEYEGNFAYCNNGWGRVIAANGLVPARSLNARDQRYATGTTTTVETLTGEPGNGWEYATVTPPPRIVSEQLPKEDRWYSLCWRDYLKAAKENESYDFWTANQEAIEAELAKIDGFSVNIFDTEVTLSIEDKKEIDSVRWYVSASPDSGWTELVDYQNITGPVTQDPPNPGKTLYYRAVVTRKGGTEYEDIIYVNCKEPKKVNVSADFSGTPSNATSNTDGVKVTSTKWYKKSGSDWVQLSASDTIKEGYAYRCEITVGATGTFTFADGYTVEINGIAATKKSGNTWYVDRTLTGYTSYVDVYDIALPEAGAKPDFTYNDEDCRHSSVALVEWFECDKDGKKLSGALSADYKFKEDAYYRLEVTAVPDANYKFDTSTLGFYIGPKAVQFYYPYQDTTYPDSVTGWKVYHVDDANGTYTVQIGDITLKDGDYLANNATAVTTTKPSGGYAYYKDGVLTLNNFVAAKLVRYYERYLEVELIGENKIGAIADYYYWDTTSNNYYTGLEFRGDGDLEFDEYYDDPCCNVSVNGDVFFNGSGDILLDAEFNCFQYTDNVIINDGYVYCYCSQFCVFGDDTNITVNGGKLKMYDGGSWYDYFICDGDLLIYAGSVYVSTDPNKTELADCVPWDGVTDLNTYECVWIVEESATVTHTVTFKVDTTTVATKTVEGGKTVTAPADPVKGDYDFFGWYTDDGELFDFVTPITTDLTLTAKFGYNVFFWLDPSDEYPVAWRDAEPGQTIEEQGEPGRVGMVFVGWFTDPVGGTKFDYSTPITGRLNLYARFAPASSYLKGDVDGNGVVDMDDAIYLLFAINFPESYPLNQPANFDGVGEEDMDDAIYLLFHVNFSANYPLH